MKYFKRELFGADDEIHNIMWKNAVIDYEREFIFRTSKRLPKEFVAYYNDSEYLHDDKLENIQIIRNATILRQPISVIAEFSNEQYIYSICYENVSKISINIEDLSRYSTLGGYLYGEILCVDKKLLSHEFYLFEIPNSIYIQFETLEFHIQRLET